MTMVNPGKRDLVSWWCMEESSGNALDSHGSNNLSSSGTISRTTGKIGYGRDLQIENNEFFYISSNSTLEFSGDVGMTIGCWSKKASAPAKTAQMLMTKARPGTIGSFYMGYGASDINSPVFGLGLNGLTTYNNVTWNGNLSTGIWYFILAWHDPTNDIIAISVNNGTPITDAHTVGMANGTAHTFRIGAFGASTYGWYDGLIDEAFISRRVYTADEREWLYNGGNGRTYADLSEIKSVNFVSISNLKSYTHVQKNNISSILHVKN